jgi:hypothetical protein
VIPLIIYTGGKCEAQGMELIEGYNQDIDKVVGV